MLTEQREEIHSLAGWLQATDADVLALAREVAGDEQLHELAELTVSGAGELISQLRTLGRRRQTPEQFFASLQ